MTQKPEKKFTSGRISASIWKNKRTFDGVETYIYSVTVNKRYQDTAKQWKTTTSFNVNEVPIAISVLQLAYQYVMQKDITVEDE